MYHYISFYKLKYLNFQDTGVSVRKRVIKILKDICIECPEFPKIPEICVKMIRRVNDEEGIRKLVMEVFQNMWFSPCPNSTRHGALDITTATADPLTRKVLNITDVVVSSRDMGLEWFQQLLMSVSVRKISETIIDNTVNVRKRPSFSTQSQDCRSAVLCYKSPVR